MADIKKISFVDLITIYDCIERDIRNITSIRIEGIISVKDCSMNEKGELMTYITENNGYKKIKVKDIIDPHTKRKIFKRDNPERLSRSLMYIEKRYSKYRELKEKLKIVGDEIEKRKSLKNEDTNENQTEINDRRKRKRKVESYIEEYFDNVKFDTNLTNGELAIEIVSWIEENYHGKTFSVKTIRPKLSYLKPQ